MDRYELVNLLASIHIITKLRHQTEEEEEEEVEEEETEEKEEDVKEEEEEEEGGWVKMKQVTCIV